jgi:uncharacterized protein YndB with AHSA1/START domain
MQMADTFVAHVSMTINASRAKVWDALVNPETIKQYMPVTNVVSEWQEKSPIVWTSDFQGKPFEVRGTILRLEPERLLEYDHSLPIFRSSPGVTRSPENYQRVTIQLRDEGAQTHLSVTERNNKTRRELEHSEGSWRMVLHGMKALLEGTSVAPLRSSLTP